MVRWLRSKLTVSEEIRVTGVRRISVATIFRNIHEMEPKSLSKSNLESYKMPQQLQSFDCIRLIQTILIRRTRVLSPSLVLKMVENTRGIWDNTDQRACPLSAGKMVVIKGGGNRRISPNTEKSIPTSRILQMQTSASACIREISSFDNPPYIIDEMLLLNKKRDSG